MAKARIETRTEGRATSPREFGAAIRAALVVCLALLLVSVLDLLGIVGTIDDSLQTRWVRLGEAAGPLQPTNASVLLVAADAETIATWGPPPWKAERLTEVLDKIEDGGPVLIAEAGHVRLFESSETVDALIRDHGLMMARSDEPRSSPWSGVGLEHGEIVLGEHSRLHLIARAAGFAAFGERLPVHWLVPSSRLPVLTLHEVVDDRHMQRSAFTQRVVLLGVTDPEYELLLDTPIGRLSPAEIEAHALTGLADGNACVKLQTHYVYLLCGGYAMLLLWAFTRLAGSRTTVLLLASCMLVLVLDYACYQRGVIRLGSAHALLTAVAIGLSYWVHEALETVSGLRKLRTRVLREAAGTPSNSDAEDESGFWDDLAELGAEYARETLAGAASATIVEREGTTWTLVVRASAGLDADSHGYIEGRDGLDLRRAPFRTPWLTLRAGWAVDMLPAGPRFGKRKTLIVPLEDEAELLGLWLIHVADDLEVSGPNCETFERLGRQMAAALVRRRERVALREQAGNNRLRDYIHTIVGGMRLLRDEQRWALELLEQLPVRALIATVWGEIEFVDPRLQAELTKRYPGLFSPDTPDDNLRVVLSRLTGKSVEEANRLLRKVVADGVEIELDSQPGLEDPGDDVWVLSRIRSKRGIDLPGFKPAVHEHILLMARSSAPAQTIRTRSGGLLRVLRNGSDKA
jgi:CHASE2 domain-containing sensor protein